MASTELSIRNNELAAPDSDESVARIEALKDELPALIDAGDTDTIKQWRDEGKAASLAAKRLGYEREAVALARQAMRCVAALGIVIARGGEAEVEQRGCAISLGAAMDRGALERVLDVSGGALNEQTPARIARQMGWTSVAGPRVRTLVLKLAKERGVGAQRMCHEAGISTVVVGYDSRRLRREWWGVRLATEALGIDISGLPPLPGRRQKSGRHYNKFVTHRFRPGGGRWDEVGVRMIAMRDEMKRADSAWVDKPLLYEAMKTVSDIIQREIRAAEK